MISKTVGQRLNNDGVCSGGAHIRLTGDILQSKAIREQQLNRPVGQIQHLHFKHKRISLPSGRVLEKDGGVEVVPLEWNTRIIHA